MVHSEDIVEDAHVRLKAASRVEYPRTQLADEALEVGQMLEPDVTYEVELLARRVLGAGARQTDEEVKVEADAPLHLQVPAQHADCRVVFLLLRSRVADPVGVVF